MPRRSTPGCASSHSFQHQGREGNWKIEIDQVVIGSCTNGRLEDLRVAAKILKGKKIAPSLRLIVIPATQEVYRQALREGLFDIFLSAGGVISPLPVVPASEAIWYSAEGERSLSTTNRNFRGRMGHARARFILPVCGCRGQRCPR